MYLIKKKIDTNFESIVRENLSNADNIMLK